MRYPDYVNRVKLFIGGTGTKSIRTRHGKKFYETIMTREKYLLIEDMGNYYRVAEDNRDLNYDILCEESAALKGGFETWAQIINELYY